MVVAEEPAVRCYHCRAGALKGVLAQNAMMQPQPMLAAVSLRALVSRPVTS
jgi:hypothetical protein